MNLDLNTLAMLAGMMGGKNPNAGAGGAFGQNGAMLETLMKLVSGMNGNAAGGSGTNASPGGAGGMLSVLPMLMSLLGNKGAQKPPSEDANASAQNYETNKTANSDKSQNDNGRSREENRTREYDESTRDYDGRGRNEGDLRNSRRQPENNYSRYTARNRFSDIDFAGAEVGYIMAKLLRTANYEKR